MAIIDLKTYPYLTLVLAHMAKERGTVRGNLFSQIRRGADVQVLELSRLQRKAIPLLSGLRFVLDGLDASNSNARRRNILIHSSRYVGIMHHLTSYLPLSDASWGCFTTSPAMLKKIEALCDKSKKPILLYAYKQS